MNTRLIQSVLKHAAAAANGPSADGDTALLRTFATTRDPAAFAELVRRYGRLVWAVCRQLRPTDADAEDAFQATFLVLLRSAGGVRTAALGPWLHTVAHRVACKAARADGRRKRRELGAAGPDRDAAVPPSAWDSLAAAVHEEVAKLPDHLRVPFVLCCLEGRGTTDAAKHLGWKLGTLSSCLTRAKQTLLDRLAKRGLPATAVAVSLTAAAVPATAAARARDLIHLGDAIPSPILELAKGATTMTKTKLLAAAVLVAAGLMTSVGGWLASADAQTPDVTREVRELAEAIDRANKKQAAKWEYHYHALLFDKNGKPAGMKAADFEKLVETMESEGWGYLGQADIAATGPTLPSLVFRRPKDLDAARRKYFLDYHGKMPPPRADYSWEQAQTGVIEVRDVILQRMRKDPTETFDSALATKLKVSPHLAAAVETYGRTVLHVDVLSALLAESRQKAPPAKPLGEPLSRAAAEEMLLEIDLLAKKTQAEAALREVEEAWKKTPDPGATRKAELLVKKAAAEAALREVAEAAKPGAGPSPDADAAALQKRMDELRSKKTLHFAPADFGITADELQDVLKEAIQRKYGTAVGNTPLKVKRATAVGVEVVEAAGPADALRWLKTMMDGVKLKPTGR